MIICLLSATFLYGKNKEANLEKNWMNKLKMMLTKWWWQTDFFFNNQKKLKKTHTNKHNKPEELNQIKDDIITRVLFFKPNKKNKLN